VPPTVTNGNLGSGGILQYYSSNAASFGAGATEPYFNISSSAFSVVYPNGHIDSVAAQYASNITTALDTGQPLVNGTVYGFFPAVANPLTPNPTLVFNGPYANYNGTIAALQAQFTDGTVPITNGAFTAQTCAAGDNQSGGGGGGTGGGGNCASSDCYVQLHDGHRIQLRYLTPGMVVATPSGKGAKVRSVELFSEETFTLTTKSGLILRCAYGHVMKDGAKGNWASGEEYVAFWNGMKVWTMYSDDDSITGVSKLGVIAEICRLHLEGGEEAEHVYIVNGIWCHNAMVKNGG